MDRGKWEKEEGKRVFFKSILMQMDNSYCIALLYVHEMYVYSLWKQV